jgi:hypothetical protein
MPENRKPHWPNVFLVGAQKAGTTSLYDWLGQHPDIYAPAAGKDFHYFSREEFYGRGYSSLDARYDSYKNEPVVINAGVNYIFYPQSLQRIHDFYPEAKILLVLRDPVQRAFSAHGFMFKLGFEAEPDFLKAIGKEQSGLLTQSNSDQSNLTYLAHGLYGQQLDALYKVFPKSQVHVAFFEDFVKDTRFELLRIFTFLNVSPEAHVELTRKNTTGGVRFRALNRLFYGDSPLKRLLKSLGFNKLIKPGTMRSIRTGVRELNTSKGQKRSLPPEASQQLIPYYLQDMALLQSLLDRDLTAVWPHYFNTPRT